ncbi:MULTISPECIES: sulfate ABC transporter permease subunit CysT [Dyella]|uniref:sulfate ABC transporter permease subunit CysT n=1 Tax=Dyella TaxID=231454 RepID=UPI000C8450B0|nr:MULTISPECIES: sulfate ABC transporter permease subunit CysT [Dyella]MDR3447896.1 sulfate ABC transporter permease subunit CysT [Dyella sp.]PMQ03416.1 Sulfate transport system permease protein CysT [Dyella sp. AD56]ULU24144.1 sulfate ABC transporter permease subunit CysT [Dyella terrae]
MRRRVLPGFGLSLGYAVAYLGLIVLLPLAALAWKASGIGFEGLVRLLSAPRTLAALRLSVGGAVVAALINVVIGLLVGWVLVRYRFPGRRLFDALVDLPFALPTAVAGIALTTLYASNGWLGRWLEPLGIKVAYTPLGVFVAMVFVGFPFVVRTLQPVLSALERDVEEAAESLGAQRWQTFFRVILPMLAPTLLTGFALALARAVGEYGSVIFIAGNIPMRSEIAPLLIVQKLEQFDVAGAAALGVAMLLLSFGLLVLVSLLQRWSRRWAERAA